jgi:hypothetical protein
MTTDATIAVSAAKRFNFRASGGLLTATTSGRVGLIIVLTMITGLAFFIRFGPPPSYQDQDLAAVVA